MKEKDNTRRMQVEITHVECLTRRSCRKTVIYHRKIKSKTRKFESSLVASSRERKRRMTNPNPNDSNLLQYPEHKRHSLPFVSPKTLTKSNHEVVDGQRLYDKPSPCSHPWRCCFSFVDQAK